MSDKLDPSLKAEFETYETKDGEVVARPKPEVKKSPAAEKPVKAKQEEPAEAADDEAEDEAPEPVKAAAEAADEAEDDEVEEAEPAPKRKNSTPPNKRIAHYRRMAGDAERRSADLERRLQALETPKSSATTQQGLTPEKQAATDTDKDRPSPDKYQYGELDSKYIADLTSYEVKKALAADRSAQEKTRQEAAAQQKAEERNKGVAKAITDGKEKYDDFVDLVVVGGQHGEYPLSDAMFDMALESAVGADVLYHLASNPEEAREIAGKSEKEQARYFGRLEAKFSSPSRSDANTKNQDEDESDESDTPPVKVKASKAPPPPKNRARGGGGRNQVTADTNDFAAFETLADRM